MSAVDAEITNTNKKKSSTSPTKDTPEKQNGAATTNIILNPKGTKETTNEPAKNGHNKQQSPHSNVGKSMNVLRERSFIRPTNPQMMHPINAAIFMADPMHHQKRRSFGQQVVSPFGMGPPHHHHQLQNSISASAIHHHQQQQQQHLRGKPELEVYRPPNVRMDGMAHGGGGHQQHGGRQNKLNAHAQEFTMALPQHHQPYPHENLLQLSKSGGNLHFTMNNHHQRSTAQQVQPFGQPQRQQKNGGVDKRSVPGAHLPNSQMPLVTSPSMSNVLQPSVHRVKFAPEPQILHHQSPTPSKQGSKSKSNYAQPAPGSIPLQRSKSLSSADTIARGLAGLGFALSADVKDIGPFPPEHQQLIDLAVQDPNQLNARDLMELATLALRRAVEARRYALPLSQLCFTIVAKERKETFLEALLNTCRQWYQEREKILGPAINSRNPSRPRFTAFMAFLTEMFCQLKRRQLQLRTVCDGVPPPMVLLTVLLKCCEDCVRPSVRSLSEIECLFYVLTCIGRDLETHLPEQLDGLLASVRDAFLNSNASAPAIRRTLLQLIELQASRWQLPGNTVLYYYPSK